MTEISTERLDAAPADEWRSYDEFAAGIDTYRLPSADLSRQIGRRSRSTAGQRSSLDFQDAETVVVDGDGTARGRRARPSTRTTRSSSATTSST